MTVENLKHTFRHQNLTEYNDEVYRERTFDALDHEFSFELRPSAATLFWRFGLVFSRTEDFAFDPNIGRYNNTDLRFIEVNVGGRSNEQWEHPNNIALSSYYITHPEPPYDPSSDYRPGTPVTLSLRYLEGVNRAPNEVWLKYDTPYHEGSHMTIPVGDYRYFRIFAWADFNHFELHLSLDVITQPAEPRYWLMRLLADIWPPNRFAVGDLVWHGSHTGRGDDRIEYDLYKKMKVGEKVLGVSVGEQQSILCQFEVAEPLHINPEHGEIVWLRVVTLFFPYIPLPYNSIYQYNVDQSDNRRYRLFDIDGEQFNQFIAPHLAFPKVRLSDVEGKYLNIIYANFLEGKQIASTYSLQQIWNDELPRTFRPEDIDPALARRGNQITLLGICQIHPESIIFYRFERALFAIQEILGDGNHRFEVGAIQLKTKLSNFSDDEMLEIFKLIENFHELHNGIGQSPAGDMSIKIMQDSVFEEYRQYSGLKSFMAKHLNKNPVRNEVLSENSASPVVDESATLDFFRTDGRRRSRSEFAPVLGIQPLAEQLAELIYHLPPDSQMVGIFGKWGRGKSYLLDKLGSYMKDRWKEEFIHIVYHAWKYQETPASWAYLYEQFADAYLGKRNRRNFFHYYWKVYRLNLRRLGVLPIVILGLSFLGWLGWIILGPIVLDWEWYFFAGSDILITISLSAIFRTFKKELSPKAIELIKKYSLRHSFKSTMGLQADIQEELITLLKVWIPEIKDRPAKPLRFRSHRKATKLKVRICLVVEDMDRCKEERIIENIDALRVLLEDPEISKRLLIVTAIDERILKQAIQKKYASLVKTDNSDDTEISSSGNPLKLNDLVSEYIDKLFIVAIKLGELSGLQRVEFLQEAIKKDLVAAKANSLSGGTTAIPVPADKSTLSIPVTKNTSQGPTFSGERSANIVGSSRQSGTATLTVMASTASAPRVDTWNGLSMREVQLLEQVVQTWELATPRQINIFYHRYLFCKNTLIGNYLASGQPNPWQNQADILTILQLLRYYSSKGTPEHIQMEKNLVQQSKGAVPVDVEHVEPKVQKPQSDYLILLEILELVVAY
jgi:hypothetical protein